MDIDLVGAYNAMIHNLIYGGSQFLLGLIPLIVLIYIGTGIYNLLKSLWVKS